MARAKKSWAPPLPESVVVTKADLAAWLLAPEPVRVTLAGASRTVESVERAGPWTRHKVGYYVGLPSAGGKAEIVHVTLKD